MVSCPPLRGYLQACSAASLWPLFPPRELQPCMPLLSPPVQELVLLPRDFVFFLCLVCILPHAVGLQTPGH
ncbi:hypothetical protein MT325_m018R [Paramecium bursaria chlorella virus MT325]|uniref:Uncharacterized protein m018R n=1 Tax=Paramecium bursaria Chlorella virus MT325 TaxID=346932 RepID=A7IT98_PBCVM|nr:hypothetical protein MT325_m018R [Paramecium bursaria chlorella virus MT325]